jgi:IclR family acetate operon transcriptional repressor
MAHGHNRATNPIQAVQTTLRIVETLKELDGAGVTEVATSLDMPKSSVHNYLSTLQQEEYVVKEGQTYHVGLRFLESGAFARHRQQIYEIAKSEITDLAEETGELVNLATIEHGMVVYLYRVSGEKAVKVDAYTGQRVRTHNTALGKAMLAQLSEEEVEHILEYHGMSQTTEHTITNSEELFDELQQIREEGVAFDREERLSGLRCIAVPIVNMNDEVEGALSVSGPGSRMKGERFDEHLPELIKNAANIIELNVTYS